MSEIIARRLGDQVVGFRLDGVDSDEERPEDDNEDALLALVTPDDLVAFGLIPEFVGRLPVVTSLEPLGEGLGADSDLAEERFGQTVPSVV